MASTSSTSTPPWKYDVFLSFRGNDTRLGFVSHLYDALCRNQIETFIDDKLCGGEEISAALLEKIEQSNVSIVIFSENYSDSPWCLDELLKIVECKETLGQVVVPVFYKVDPIHVQELSDSYGDALAEHERKFSSDKVNRWKEALTEIANLKGWDSSNIKPETKLIEEIVGDVLNKLNLESSSSFDGLVGIDSQVKEVESLLCLGRWGVCIVGIWGMGGIGKTTIAEVIFNRISAQFEGRCFLPSIRQELEKSTLVALRNKILSEVLEIKNLSIGTLNLLPTPIKKMLQRKKVLIVLDDVSSCQQLKALVGEDCLLGQGSRVIVTSRDVQVLKNLCGSVYKVEELGCCEALRLFRLHAFQQNCPSEEHMQLSKRMVEYAKGIPLALKVLGSNLYDKDVKERKNELGKLQGTLDVEIQKILRISYDGLDPTEKFMFLDIACFFKTCSKDRVEKIFDLCGFFAARGISRLNDMCLINIFRDQIKMHDLLQKLGQDVVREECIIDPRKRSRLWNPEDIRHVLTHYKGTETVEVISMDMSKIDELNLSRSVFKGMYNLRLLEFYNPRFGDDYILLHEILEFLPRTRRLLDEFNYPRFGDSRIRLAEGLEFLSNTISVLHWDQYPLKSLPSNFYPKNLVELRMRNSNLEQIWNEFPRLVNLKIMDLSYCEKQIRIPDLSKVPNLEVLDLTRSKNLVEMPSIGHCSKLTRLELRECCELCSLPSLLHLTSLKVLNLKFCKKIEEFPEIPSSLEELLLTGTSIKEVPSSIGNLSKLIVLKLGYCNRLESVPSSIGLLKSLVELDRSGCKHLAGLPNSIYDMETLETLDLYLCENLNGLPKQDEHGVYNTSMQKTPSSISHLVSLQFLSLGRCGISELPYNLGSMVSLRKLTLSWNHFERMPTSINQLSELISLNMNQCLSLQCLPELPSRLKRLYVSGCSSLKSIQSIFPQVQNEYAIEEFECFDFAECYQLDARARFRIMSDAQLRIQNMAASMFNQVLQKYGDPIDSRYSIPGNEVPKWFSYKNIDGSSIKITKLPHSNSNSQLLGWAFCAVVASPEELHHSGDDDVDQDDDDDFDFLDNLPIRCECHLITESGRHDLHLSNTFSWTSVYTMHKPHVFIWYNSSFSSNFCLKEASFKFYIKNHGKSLSEHKGYHVIKCGVHPLLAHHDKVNQQ